MEKNFDVVVVGGGLVGAAFALALKGSGLKLAVIEAQPPQLLPADDSWDSRIYAVSPGNAAFLKELGIWDEMAQARIAPVYEMRVFGDDNTAQLHFDAYEAGLSELTFILESRLLQNAMWQKLQAGAEIEMLCPAECESIDWLPDEAVLRLNNGDVLHARLVIGADGAQSWVRREAGIEAKPRAYQQMGVVANFATEKSHANAAHQWFRPDGVLAWLPLPDNKISIVWSVWEDKAQELIALPAEEFTVQVAEAGGHALGRLRLVTKPAAFPLRILNLDSMIKPRLALIGDAAHNVHPLAGQGVNLGFRDAKELAKVLRERGPFDCGDYHLLRRYERARQEDILTMQLTTDALQKLFNNSNPLLGALRNIGLSLTNHLGWLKNRLVQHALR
jgi:2-octaprenylphenol hydroxylase